MVTYGGMSKKPVIISTGAFIFRDLRFRGFWMTEWNKIHEAKEREDMLFELAQMVKGSHLKVSTQSFHYTDYINAVKESMKPYQTAKSLLVFDSQ